MIWCFGARGRTCSGLPWRSGRLRTVESISLQRIALWPCATTFVRTVPEAVRQEWREIDRLLVQFWFSRSIRPKVTRGMEVLEGSRSRDHELRLMPKLARRGLVDLVGAIPESMPAAQGTTMSEKRISHMSRVPIPVLESEGCSGRGTYCTEYGASLSMTTSVPLVLTDRRCGSRDRAFRVCVGR